ncbi:MAG: hypothetical protein NTY94_22610 [Alphaproteobacteria bacterium]|nr:hypothetical protein [Alphaproteobacteria bacterium]
MAVTPRRSAMADLAIWKMVVIWLSPVWCGAARQARFALAGHPARWPQDIRRQAISKDLQNVAIGELAWGVFVCTQVVNQ